MLQYYKANLSVDARWLIENGVITECNYDALVNREDVRVVRRGCRNSQALVDYESLPDRYKKKIQAMIGNPYTYVNDNALERHLEPSIEAADYFEAYKVDGVRHLPGETVRRYHAEACILNAIAHLLSERKGKRSALGHRQSKLWDDIVNMVAALPVQRWPHNLPTNARSLERKYKAYQTEGYESLIHKNWRNGQRNAAKIGDRGTDSEAYLLALASDPRNLDNEQVARLYNAKAAEEGWPAITGKTVGEYRRAHEQDIYARRHGATAFRAKKLMTVKRSAPSAPLYLWTLDGWDAELLYQDVVVSKNGGSKTVYHKRLTLEVVLDACTKYPIGYAIGDTESPALVTEALRNAVNHTAELFGHRYKPNQIQMDHAGYKTLETLYTQMSNIVTPAAVRNAKAKVVEPWFRTFNDRYCHLQTNWSGYGLTARKESQPNVELINKYRHDFPDRAGCIAQLEKFINMERARLRDEYVAKWNAMPQENRFPLSDEQYLLAYGVKSEKTYLMRNTGITMTLPGTGGRKIEYDCFDHQFRQYASVRWQLLYDPQDSHVALAVSEDGSLRFLMEEKHLQPMALIERREGDAAALQRVRDYNRAEEQRISNIYASMPIHEEVLELSPAEELNRIAARRDYETLSKLCIVDSEGQHKSVKAEARLKSNEPYDDY